MLFLIKLIDINDPNLIYKFGIFMNGAYPLPQGDDFNTNITYYSF